ncbi:MAG: hypothetical protein ACXVBE_11980, partial [Bdellovibrionota bacterium]
SAARWLIEMPTDDDIRLSADLLIAARNEFRKKFQSKNFFVLLYPSGPSSEWYNRKLLAFLEKAGVTYFDYSGLFELQAPGYQIPRDGHPTAFAQGIIADALARDLKKLLP